MPAVKNCRGQLTVGDSTTEAGRRLAEAMLLRAGNDYIEHARRFSVNDLRVAEHFHLHELSSTTYWEGMVDESMPAAGRLRELVSLYSRLMFASSHLPRLLSLIRETGSAGSGGVTTGSAKSGFSLKLTELTIATAGAEEKVESAADPDRIARVIDGANMVYQGAALLAGGTAESLRLESITGHEDRRLLFHGQQESATAVRRIIRHLSAISSMAEDATNAGSDSEQDVETLVQQLPFLESLDELERIGALSGELIDDIRSNVVAGSIMLVEAGVILSERETPDGQAYEMLPVLSDAAVDVVETEVEAHYLDNFEAVRERMLGDTASAEPAQDDSIIDNEVPRKPAPTALNGDNSDDLDDLIVDLNRLYKR